MARHLRHSSVTSWASAGKMLLLPALLLVPCLGTAQAPQQSGALTITGHTGKAPVVQISGKYYVEVEALARLTNGSVSFHGNQVTLTLSASAPNPPAPATAAPLAEPPAKRGYSRDFLKATIDAMGAIKDWRTAIVNAVQHTYPVTEDLVGGFRSTADSKLSLVSAAAATDSDRECVPLITSEFANMQKLSDQYLATQKNMTYVSPDAVGNDPLDQQVLSCAHSLSSLPAGGAFQDAAACH
jgi:hypothetical protein